ncbi:hypothetical protein AOG2_18730 [Geobacter sp. AOG2]|nr:hypothetical protein AOG2_18730 [Geobacter sp. AOG2]
MTILVFGNSLKNKFVYDDNILLVGNPTYKYFDTWKLLFTPFNPANGVEYLPVRDVSYAIDYFVWGENPVGFHLSNIIIYIFTGIICYFFSFKLLSILKNDSLQNESLNETCFVSFIITLFFIIHPIHSQVVSFIIQRNALLSAFFFFLTLYVYLLFEQSENIKMKIIFYCLALLFCLLALFSKATSVTLPILLLIITTFNKNNKTWSARMLQLAPFFLMGLMAFRLISSVARHTNVIKSNLIEFGAYSLTTKLATAIQIPCFYIYKLFVPFNLAPEYDIAFAKNFLSFAVVGALGATVFAFWYAWKNREKSPYLLFCLCWLFITLAPVLNLMPTQPVVADRYAYLPSYAFCFALSILLYRTAKLRHEIWLKAVCLFYLATLSGVAFYENTIWKDEKTLFTTMIQRAPHISKGYANLGYVYFNEKQYDKAFGLLQRAYQLDPTKPDYELKRGMIAFRKNNLEEAIGYYKKALAINEQSMAANYFMGISYSRLGDYKSALSALQNVLDSTDADTNSFKYKTMLNMNLYIYPKLKPELDVLRASTLQNPDDLGIRRKLADTLLQYGMLDEALGQYQEVEKRNNTDWQALFSMAKIYRHKKDWQTAMNYVKQALSLKPQEEVLLSEMGILHMAIHNTSEAIMWFGRISPKKHELYALSRYYTAVCYFQRGNREKAEYYFGLVDQNYPEMKLKTAPYTKKLAAL